MNKLTTLPHWLVAFCLSLLCIAAPAFAAGEVSTWGRNANGILGDGTTLDRHSPVQLSGLTDVVSLALGGKHGLAAKRDGSVWVWGYARAGDGTNTRQLTPVQVPGLGDAIEVAAGNETSYVLRSDGTVWAWGFSSYGSGAGPEGEFRPAQVAGLSGIVAISAYYEHRLALKGDGTVWAWGLNDRGQLGDETTSNRSYPVQVKGLTNAVAISAGGGHSLALRSDGIVWAWGINDLGQLGNGTSTSETSIPANPRPVQVLEISGVVAVSAGSTHSLALKADGTVWGWGSNNDGQLGDGSTGFLHDEPVQVQAINAVAAIASGANHSVALRNDGSVWAWGGNNNGQLGDDTTTRRLRPVPVAGLQPAALVAASSSRTAAVTSPTYAISGRIADENGVGVPGVTVRRNPAGRTAVTNSAGYYTIAANLPGEYTLTPSRPGTHFSMPSRTIAVTTASVAGVNFLGRSRFSVSGTIIHAAGQPLANIEVFVTAGTSSRTGSPVLTDGAGRFHYDGLPDGNYTITPVSPGYVFLPRSRTLSIFGSDIAGQNFTGHTPRNLSGRITTSAGAPVEGAVVTIGGLNTSVATDSNGNYTFERLAPGTYSLSVKRWATEFTPASRTVTVGNADAVGIDFTGNAVVVNQNGRHLWAWGNNFYGALGDGTGINRSVPVRIATMDNLVQVSAGRDYTLAMRTDGSVWAWGANDRGQLGDGTTVRRNSPIPLSSLTDIKTVAAGWGRSLALKNDGTVLAWGNGSNNGPSVPTPVPGLSDIVAVSAGSHSIALKSDGTVWTWGTNFEGQLGDGTQTDRSTPARVNGIDNVVAISAGFRQTVALKSDGTVWVWGAYFGSRLAHPATQPVPVFGFSNISAVSAGVNHVAALKNDGTVWTWGANWEGQLGNGTTNSHEPTPAQVAGLNGVVAVVASWEFTLALKSDGTVWSWGDNRNGTLGDGSGADRYTPVQVQGLNRVSAISSSGDHVVALALPAYAIVGRVTDNLGNPLAGVSVVHSGSPTPTTTNNDGYYTFTDVPNGNYTVTASKAGLRFSPPARVVTIASGDSHQTNFIGYTGYSVSGRIADESGHAVVGLAVYRTGHDTPVVTNSAGYYTFTNVPDGSSTITPSDSGRVFQPASRTVTVSGDNVSGQNFVASVPYRIIGRIATSDNTPLEGVVVTRSGSDVPAITNNAGYYVFNGVVNGNYTVTPQLDGYTFTPADRSVRVNGSDATGQNFIGGR